jgi:hypothetical protein
MRPRDERGQAIPLLAFGVAIVGFALTYAVLQGPADQLVSMAAQNSTASSTDQGISWVEQMIAFLPAAALALAVAGLLSDTVFEGGGR